MKETEQTLFLKSNLLHIRTNEGVFEVSNPEVVHTSPLVQFHRKWNDGDEVEWPYGVELIHACASDVCTEDGNCDYCREPKKLARLLPKEEKKDDQRCPDCGYSIEDAQMHMDHHLCKNKDFFKKVESPEPQEKPVLLSVYQKPNIDPSENIEEESAPVSAPSESQEEMWKDLGNKWNQMAIIRMGTDEIVNELAKNFKITRNP